ncbi:MAG TPA: hypothetical protein VFF40_10965 [Acidimicrobiia bacterium]|nr:hypothetical protein [Acidimicrobiia bacterium]
MKFAVGIEGTLTVTGHEADEINRDFLAEHLDQVMEELLDLDARDATIDLDLTDGAEVRISIVVDAANPVDAVNNARDHAFGDPRRGWRNSRLGRPDRRTLGHPVARHSRRAVGVG